MYTQESPGQGRSAARGRPDPVLSGSHSWRDVGEPSHTSLEPRETTLQRVRVSSGVEPRRKREVGT